MNIAPYSPQDTQYFFKLRSKNKNLFHPQNILRRHSMLKVDAQYYRAVLIIAQFCSPHLNKFTHFNSSI
jgi:hypothetical protein